jgi:hypothetical protein
LRIIPFKTDICDEELLGQALEQDLRILWRNGLPHSILSMRYKLQRQYKDTNAFVPSLLHMLLHGHVSRYRAYVCELHMQSERHPCTPQLPHSRGIDGYTKCNTTTTIDHVRCNDTRTTSAVRSEFGRARPSPVLRLLPTYPARRRLHPTCSAGI